MSVKLYLLLLPSLYVMSRTRFDFGKMSEVLTHFKSDSILFKTLLTLEGRLHQGSARPGGTSMCEAVVF